MFIIKQTYYQGPIYYLVYRSLVLPANSTLPVFLGFSSLPPTALRPLNKSRESSQIYCTDVMVDVDCLKIAEFQHLRLIVDHKSQAITVPYTGIYAQKQQNQESLGCV